MSKEEIDARVQELLKLDKEELARRLATLETMVKRLGPEVNYFLRNLMMPVRAIRRDFRPIFGILMGVRFDIAEFEILVDATERDYMSGTKTRELKTVRIKPSSLVSWEIIHEREEIPPEKPKSEQ